LQGSFSLQTDCSILSDKELDALGADVLSIHDDVFMTDGVRIDFSGTRRL
jgi:hypothetical protein